MLDSRDKIYIDHINGRWEATTPIEDGYHFITHRQTRAALLDYLSSQRTFQGYRVIDITGA